MAKEEIKKTIEELEALEKSEKQELDGIEALEKALAEFDDLEELEKSDDNDEDDKGGDSDPDEEEDGEDEKEDDKGAEPVKKSEDDLDELERELVKASEAYEDLENSVHALKKSVSEETADIRSALAGLTELVQAIGKGVVTLSKSVKEFGGQPASASGAHIGMGIREEKSEGEPITKSKSEVVSILKKAVQEGRCNANWLAKVSVNGPGCLPESVRRDLGL